VIVVFLAIVEEGGSERFLQTGRLRGNGARAKKSEKVKKFNMRV
jgi:hypothetical protein